MYKLRCAASYYWFICENKSRRPKHFYQFLKKPPQNVDNNEKWALEITTHYQEVNA